MAARGALLPEFKAVLIPEPRPFPETRAPFQAGKLYHLCTKVSPWKVAAEPSEPLACRDRCPLNQKSSSTQTPRNSAETKKMLSQRKVFSLVCYRLTRLPVLSSRERPCLTGDRQGKS